MKLNSLFSLMAAGLAIAPSALAFPAFANIANMDEAEINAMMKRFQDMPREPKEKRQVQVPTIGRKQIPDADHPFIPPSKTAQRGPCPGTNLMANYGYINREGITDFDELVYGQQEVMGWALDLSTLLAGIAIAVDGNPTNGKVSIGYADARTGTIPVIGGSNKIPGGYMNHNAYEIDASLTRVDKAIGDNRVLNGTLYQQIWDVADRVNNGVVNVDVMSELRSLRYNQSKQDDPQFTFAPIGLLFIGADGFLYSTMVSSLPDGSPGPCTRETLSSFYGAKSTGPNTWEYVPEELPEDWYRRGTPLTIAGVVHDQLPSLLVAAERGELPVGVTANSFKSPEAFTCALKKIIFGQIPASLYAIDALGSFLKDVGGLASTC